MLTQPFFRRGLRLPVLLSVLLLPAIGQAKNIGADPPSLCPTCSKPSVVQPSGTSTRLSRTEGNLTETVPIHDLKNISGGPTIDLKITYNSYNADGSRAVVDTILGYGWTHSYNIFLFSQFAQCSAMTHRSRNQIRRWSRWNLHCGSRILRDTGQKPRWQFYADPKKTRPNIPSPRFPRLPFWFERTCIAAHKSGRPQRQHNHAHLLGRKPHRHHGYLWPHNDLCIQPRRSSHQRDRPGGAVFRLSPIRRRRRGHTF